MISVGLTVVGSQVGAAAWTFRYAGDRSGVGMVRG